MTREDFWRLPPLRSAFPLVHDNGAQWTRLTAVCSNCKTKLDADMLRGNVARPFARVFVVEAFALCERCNLFIPIRYRLHDDMAMTGLDSDGRTWLRWTPVYSWWSRLWLWYRRLVKKT